MEKRKNFNVKNERKGRIRVRNLDKKTDEISSAEKMTSEMQFYCRFPARIF